MTNKNLLSDRDKELQTLAEQFESAIAENKSFYLDADDFADLTDWYGTRTRYDNAFEAVDYGLKIHPDSTPLLVQKAYLYIDTNKKDLARQLIKSIKEDTPEVKVLRAHLLLNEGKLSAAEELLNTIEEKEELGNVVDVSYMYLDMGYPEKALEWLSPVLKKYAENEAFIAVTADCFHAQGLIDKASFFYNKLIDINPYSAPYWFGLAKCYFEMHDFDKAIDACDYAIVSDDQFTDAYVMKGHAFFQLGNEDEALKCYQQAEKLHGIAPDFICMYIGLCKVSKGEWEEAFKNLEMAIKLNDDLLSPLLPSIYSNAGLCLHKLGKIRKAHQYCKKAQELAPSEVENYLIEGRIYMEEEKLDKAIKQWATALEYDPSADTWCEIGTYSMDFGYFEYAKTAFERVLELEPEFEGINERLTILYLVTHDKENFMKYNQKCAKPIELKELENVIRVLESNEDKSEITQYMQEIIKGIQ